MAQAGGAGQQERIPAEKNLRHYSSDLTACNASESYLHNLELEYDR